MERMNHKIGIGVLWNLASMFMSRGASTIFTLFLARLLAPEAFGLIAMVTVCFQVAGVLVQSGLGQALIRSKQVSQADLSTAFFANLGLSVLAYISLFFSAPLVSGFYNQPGLTLLIRIMGLVVFLNAAKIVQSAVFNRDMNFKVPMKANTWAVIISGVIAVTAAFLGAGVWSLVIQMLVSAGISSTLLWLASSWRPRFVFELDSFFRLFRFGRHLLAEGVLQVLYENSYVLVIGRLFSAELTGLYFFANKISTLISRQLTGAVQQATLPALATLQDDNENLRKKYRQVIQVMMFMIAPAMLILAGLASPLFSLLFDERWQGAIPYLQLLCLVGALYPVHAMNINILNVKGRSDLILKVGLIKKAVNLTLLFLAIPYGVLGIVISQVIGAFLALIPNTYYSSRLIGYSLRAQILDVIKPMGSGLLSASAAWVVTTNSSLPTFWLLCVAAFLGISVYFLISMIVRAEGIMLIAGKIKQRFMARKALA